MSKLKSHDLMDELRKVQVEVAEKVICDHLGRIGMTESLLELSKQAHLNGKEVVYVAKEMP